SPKLGPRRIPATGRVGFPRDDYTPFGLLANPSAQARSWVEGSGGVLRATEHHPGFGWLEPWATRPAHGVSLEIGFEHGGERFLGRDAFTPLSLSSGYHSGNLFDYTWEHAGLGYEVRFFRLGPHTIVGRWRITNPNSEALNARLLVGVCVWFEAGARPRA